MIRIFKPIQRYFAKRRINALLQKHIDDNLARRTKYVRNEKGQFAKVSYFKPDPPIRDKEHLKWVADLACCCCGAPADCAHHLLRTNEKCMGRKSGDDKVLPLCNYHHDSLHRNGNEPAFLASHGVKTPIEYAKNLYEVSLDLRNK